MPTLAERLEILERRVAQLETERDRYRQAAEIMANEKVGGTFPAVVELTWLNRVGAVVVVAGLVLAAAWANDRGYLSPPLRNGLLLAGAALVLAVGIRQMLSSDVGRRGFGYGVATVGALGLYLVPFTASQLDAVIPSQLAVAATIAITVGLALAGWRARLDALATLAAIGGLTAPLIASADAANVWLLFAYLSALTVGMLAVQRATGWTSIGVILATGCGAYYASVATQTPGAAVPALVGLALFFPLYAQGALAERVMDEAERKAPAIAAAFGALVCWLDGSALGAAAVGVAVAALALYLGELFVAVIGMGIVALAFAAGVGGPLASLVAGVAFGLVVIATGVRFASSTTRAVGIVALVLSLVRLVVVDVWKLDAGVRVGALLILGVGLLVASFLYSRYADRLRGGTTRPPKSA
jgi:uncharacterized membrane protein